MRRVVIESPFAGDTAKNTEYALAAVADCLKKGEAPIASHLLFPQLLDDTIPKQRKLGIEAGLVWGGMAEYAVFYTDRGISPGMKSAETFYKNRGIKIEYRSIPGWQ